MKKRITPLLIALFLTAAPVCSAYAAPATLQEKFTGAQAGHFIVTAQEGNYSLLFIRSIASDTLVLEEISAPAKQIDLKTIDWKKWAAEKAPGHTSWTLYEIDRTTGELIECFSVSKNGWLFLDASEQFLARLLTLPLSAVKSAERKKIGLPPVSGEDDRRPLWNPPLVYEGKKNSKPDFDVWQTQWPDDSTRLALCTIELYFAKSHPSFPFPYWIEVHSPHYAFKMRAVDSGQGLVSALPGPMPHRTPQILTTVQKGEELWKLLIQTPPYFPKIQLFAVDVTGGSSTTIPIAFSTKSGAKNGEMLLEIPTSKLQETLKSGHRYQWAIVPEGSSIYIESEESFAWH